MLLFLIILGIVIGITIFAIKIDSDFSFGVFGGWMVVIIFIICMVFENACPEAQLAKYQQEHDVLQYQVDNDFYTNNSKQDLYRQVLNYNKMVAAGREKTDNIWIGTLYSDIYKDLEFIELG